MPRLVPFALAALLATSAFAQTPQFSDPANLGVERVAPRTGRELPIDSGTLGLEQLLRKLNTRASILNIVAHPDDEDGGMLTLYARGFGARVADLSLTRGEGGQNAMTGDFEDALGLLRTQELLANDRYTGVTQMFGTEVDFGFSKTKSEAFTKWTHERVLYDAVRAIRIYRPLVITATFIGNPTDGHGQHQVSGEIAQEAFIAAGDPNVFPELTKEGILPWKPLKMYARVPRGAISGKGLFDYATNQNVPAEFTNYITHITTTTPPSTDIVVHEGTPDPLLTIVAANHADLPPSLAAESPSASLSYVQFARLGLGLQKSQIGPGVRTASSGAFDVDYHRYGSKLEKQPQHEENFFDGIDTSLVGIADLAPHAPPSLRTLLRDTSVLISQAGEQTARNKMKEVAKTLEMADSKLECAMQEVGSMNRLIDVGCVLPDVDRYTELTEVERRDVLHELAVKRAQISEAAMFALNVQVRATTPSNHGALEAGKPFTVTVTTTSSAFKARSIELRNTWVKAKFQSGSLSSGTDILDVSAEEARRFTTTLPYFHRTDNERPVYALDVPELRNAPLAPPPLIDYVDVIAGHDFELDVVVTDETTGQPIRFVPSQGSAEHVHPVGYGDLPRTNILVRPAKQVSAADLTLPTRRRIAFVPGTGDAVPEALKSVGLSVTTLTVADLTPAKLANFDTIILGVRTYNAHPDLHGAPTQALLDFARNGGNVVVQYQTQEFTAADAPYPLDLGSDEKVVDETAPVTLLKTQNSLLTTPNQITPADFNNWIEERGHGFMSTWDAHYTALTETHDPGSPSEHVAPQLPQRGGLLTCAVGKGRWTYVAFALYRQLPEAVPGAYRLFLNLLDNPR